MDTLKVNGAVGSSLTTTTTGILAKTLFQGATNIGSNLVVTSTGAVKRINNAATLLVAGAPTTISNQNVMVNSVVGAVIP